MSRLPASAAALSAVFALGACSLLPPILRGDTSPAWVRGDATAYEGRQPGFVYATGAASGISDPVLRREAAEAAARAALAQRISAHVSSELLAYAASTGAALGETAERHTERTLRQRAEA